MKNLKIRKDEMISRNRTLMLVSQKQAVKKVLFQRRL